MISDNMDQRPDCENLLSSINSWTLCYEDLVNQNQFIDLEQQILSNEQSIEQSFHKFFIKTKLNKINKQNDINSCSVCTQTGTSRENIYYIKELVIFLFLLIITIIIITVLMQSTELLLISREL